MTVFYLISCVQMLCSQFVEASSDLVVVVFQVRKPLARARQQLLFTKRFGCKDRRPSYAAYIRPVYPVYTAEDLVENGFAFRRDPLTPGPSVMLHSYHHLPLSGTVHTSHLH